jgi:hypothetical protein
VAKVTSQGKIRSPDIANSSQLFSQGQVVRRFMGAAKLPLNKPARITIPTAHAICPFMNSPESAILDDSDESPYLAIDSRKHAPGRAARSRKFSCVGRSRRRVEPLLTAVSDSGKVTKLSTGRK